MRNSLQSQSASGSSGAVRDLLTYEDAARQLQVSTRTLRRAVAVRELGHVKLGRSVRFRQEHLDKWIQRSTVTTRRVNL